MMKKTALLILIAILLNGCRYVNTKEAYLDAKAPPKLIIPEGVDSPNSSSILDVPHADDVALVVEEPDTSPPDMPIRTRQSEKGNLRIENNSGYPVLSARVSKDVMWNALAQLKVDNWSIENTDENQCKLTMKYTDQAALERKNANFVKKIFTREDYYTDYSGLFTMQCEQQGSITKATFKKQDGTAAKSFLADNVMQKLYALLEKS